MLALARAVKEAIVEKKRASIPGVLRSSKTLWNSSTLARYVATEWDGHRSGDDDNYCGPTLDVNSDDVHPAEPAIRKGYDRKGCDQRQVFANMMAKSKDKVSYTLKSVSLDKALKVNKKMTCTRSSSWAPIVKRAEAA